MCVSVCGLVGGGWQGQEIRSQNLMEILPKVDSQFLVLPREFK